MLRSDRTHDPHCDRYDQFGRKRTDLLPPHLSPNEIVDWTIVDIKAHWRDMRRTYYEGLP